MERFWTSEEIEREVDKVSGTWVKRRNLREKLKRENNAYLSNEIEIEIIRRDIRKAKANGAKLQSLIIHFCEITELELKKL